MTEMHFGAVQLQIMQVLWEKKRVNAREITKALNDKSETEIAHSTIQTLLRQLEQKGAVSHMQEGRTFIFYPLVHQDIVANSEIRKLVNRFFNGSAGELMAHLLKQETISHEELETIKILIEEKEGKS